MEPPTTSPESRFAHLTLAELQVMLRDTLQHATPSDAAFVQALCHAIAARQAQP